MAHHLNRYGIESRDVRYNKMASFVEGGVIKVEFPPSKLDPAVTIPLRATQSWKVLLLQQFAEFTPLDLASGGEECRDGLHRTPDRWLSQSPLDFISPCGKPMGRFLGTPTQSACQNL